MSEPRAGTPGSDGGADPDALVSGVPVGLESDPVGTSSGRAGGVMVACIFLSRVLGLLRNSVMTAMFGVGLATDAYQLAVLIPDLLFMLIAGGGLSSAFIPVFSELLHTKREREAWRLFNVIVTVCSLVVVVLIAAAWVAAPWIAQLLAAHKTDAFGHNVSAQMEPQVVYMGRILLPAQFAFLIGSILLGTLYARRQFAAPGLAPNVYNVGIIIGAIVGGRSPLGIAGMPWGAAIGALIGNLAIPVALLSTQGVRFQPSLDIRTTGVKKFFSLLAPVIIGFSLPSVCQMITTYFAARYPAGINTVLLLGSTLMQAPSGIFGQGLALAAFPVLTQLFANRRMEAYRSELNRTLRTVIYVSMPAAAIMLAIAPEIIHALYAYGRARHDTDLQEVSRALRIYSLGVVAWCIQPVLMRGFFSAHKTLFPVALSTGMTAIFIAMCAYCTATGQPYTSLAWSTDIAAVLLIVVLYWALEREVGVLDRWGIAATLGKSLTGAVAAGGAAFGAMRVFGLVHLGLLALIASILVVLCLAGWAFYFTTGLLKMPETAYFDRATARLRRRGS